MILLSLQISCGLLLIAASLIGGALPREYRWIPAGVGMLLLIQTGILMAAQSPPTPAPLQAKSSSTPDIALPLPNNSKAEEWFNASPAIRQNTAVKWLKELRLRGTFVLSIRSETEYIQWAAALSRCLDNTAEKLEPTTELLGFAESHCLPKLKHYRYGSAP